MPPFALIYDPEVKSHLRAIERRFHGLIRRMIEEQLRFEPDTETRNRKPLQRSVAFDAKWELRFGPENRFRVFYRVSHTRREVRVLGVGVKERNQLMLGGEEIKL